MNKVERLIASLCFIPYSLILLYCFYGLYTINVERFGIAFSAIVALLGGCFVAFTFGFPITSVFFIIQAACLMRSRSEKLDNVSTKKYILAVTGIIATVEIVFVLLCLIFGWFQRL